MINISRENHYNNDILFVDGHGGTGKVLIASILECYPNVEKRIEDEHLSMLASLWKMKKIDRDAFVSTVQTILDRRIHYLALSRQINLKHNEVMSVFKYPYPLKYLKRYFITDRDKADSIIENEKPILLNQTQNAMSVSDIYFEAFDKRLKILYINRNPIEVIYDMYNRKFIDRIGNSPSNIRYTFKYDERNIPVFAADWKDEFLRINDMERVVRWIYELTKSDREVYKNLPNTRNRQILHISFDKLVTNPNKTIEKINYLLLDRPTHKIKRRLKKENCPRIIDYELRKEKENFIRSELTSKYEEMFDWLINEDKKWLKTYK